MSRGRVPPLLAVVGLAVVVMVVVPGSARPAYPGSNGLLVFTSDRDDPFGDLYTTSADGSGSLTRFGLDKTVDRSPAWSPDGTRIAFGSVRPDGDDIYVMDADGGNVTNLTRTFAGEYEPTWSPDGKQIAFVSDRDGNNEIYVMNADGSDQRRLTDNDGSDDEPAWSPNPEDNRIAFNSSRDGFFNDVFLMDADTGENVTKLTPDEDFSAHASWSPDGSRIAFRRTLDGQTEIYAIELATGELTNLTDNPAQDREPAWSPDGNRIAFVSRRDDNWELYVMDADGTGQTRVTDDPASDTEPNWQPLSKAVSVGTSVIASVEDTIIIAATPVVDFGSIAVGATKTAAPASVSVTTNGAGYTLSASRTSFSGGADIPFSVAVTAPAGASTLLTGQTAIPTDGSLTVGSRPGGAVSQDEWNPIYRLGPVPLRPAGTTSAVVTYTVVAM